MQKSASDFETSDFGTMATRRHAPSPAAATQAAATTQIGPIVNALGLIAGLLLLWGTICVI